MRFNSCHKTVVPYFSKVEIHAEMAIILKGMPLCSKYCQLFDCVSITFVPASVHTQYS